MDIKQSSFILLIILASVSGVFEFAQTNEVISEQTGISILSEFGITTVQQDIETIDLATENSITSIQRLDLVGILFGLVGLLITIFQIFMKLMFGWIDLIYGIFKSSDLESLSIVFIGPIGIVQLLGITYIIRDIAGTVRGVSG